MTGRWERGRSNQIKVPMFAARYYAEWNSD